MNSNTNPSSIEFATPSGIICLNDPTIGLEPDFLVYPDDMSFGVGLRYPFGEDYSEEAYSYFINVVVKAVIVNTILQTKVVSDYNLLNSLTGEVIHFNMDDDVYEGLGVTKKQ